MAPLRQTFMESLNDIRDWNEALSSDAAVTYAKTAGNYMGLLDVLFRNMTFEQQQGALEDAISVAGACKRAAKAGGVQRGPIAIGQAATSATKPAAIGTRATIG